MKNTLIICLLLVLSSCQPKELPTIFEFSDGYALVKLSHQSTKGEMESMFGKLDSLGYTCDYLQSEFFKDGKLRRLRLTVVCPDGKGGFTSPDLAKLQFRYYGFQYQKTGSPIFKIGAL
ncbi:MAG: hypothetical protein H7X99_10555 [Saprospiraceae bacterium]|nr:hypothetical protein [Saprospiraceae bacterium]